MKIAILSDVHDQFDNLARTIKYLNSNKIETILFAGDLIAPGNGVETLSKFRGKVHSILGNNDGEEYGMFAQYSKHPHLNLANKFLEIELGGKKIFINHYPRIGEIAYESGLFDLVIYGHDHIKRLEFNEQSILLNPGSLHPFGIEDPSFAIYDTQTNEVEFVFVKDI